MHVIRKTICFLLLASATALYGADAPSIDLKLIDQARGLSEDGLKYTIDFVQSSETSSLKKSFDVHALADFGHADQTKPAAQKMTLLKRGRALWKVYKRTGRTQLVRRNQLKTGMPSVANIMTTPFARDYSVSKVEQKEGQLYAELAAVDNSILYPKVEIVVDPKTGLCMSAMYFSEHGHKHRTVEFAYAHQHPGPAAKGTPFISQLDITDHVIKGRKYSVAFGKPEHAPELKPEFFSSTSH